MKYEVASVLARVAIFFIETDRISVILSIGKISHCSLCIISDCTVFSRRNIVYRVAFSALPTANFSNSNG